MTERECEYCKRAVPLVIGNTNDKGICLMYPNYLSAYGYDIHGSDSNGLCVKINYCPMCGRELKVKQMTNEMTNEEASEKGMSDNFEAQPTDAVKCDCTTEEIAKSFTEDVEAVKDQLDGQPTNITVEMHPKEAIEILEYKGTAYNIRRESEE